MITVRWERYPLVGQHPEARRWLQYTANLGRAWNTVDAYGRAVHDHLAKRKEMNPEFFHFYMYCLAELADPNISPELRPYIAHPERMVRGIVALVFRCRTVDQPLKSTTEAQEIRWLTPEELSTHMDEAYAVRQQRRGERVAGMPLVLRAVEGEAQHAAAVDLAAPRQA